MSNLLTEQQTPVRISPGDSTLGSNLPCLKSYVLAKGEGACRRVELEGNLVFVSQPVHGKVSDHVHVLKALLSVVAQRFSNQKAAYTLPSMRDTT